jgi:ecotin
MNRLFLVLPILLISACATAMPGEGDLAAWPPAGAGETRFVIRLPALEDESSHRVELEIGKEMEIDCNRHWFGGTFERQVVSGWGYPMYRLGDVAGPASTMMACPGESKRTAFVHLRLEDPFLGYNSKLPIVVYVPDGFVVRYRTWSPDGESRPATAE